VGGVVNLVKMSPPSMRIKMRLVRRYISTTVEDESKRVNELEDGENEE